MLIILTGHLVVQIYIIEMQTIKENTNSSPVTIYKSQTFLYKVPSLLLLLFILLLFCNYITINKR